MYAGFFFLFFIKCFYLINCLWGILLYIWSELVPGLHLGMVNWSNKKAIDVTPKLLINILYIKVLYFFYEIIIFI